MRVSLPRFGAASFNGLFLPDAIPAREIVPLATNVGDMRFINKAAHHRPLRTVATSVSLGIEDVPALKAEILIAEAVGGEHCYHLDEWVNRAPSGNAVQNVLAS